MFFSEFINASQILVFSNNMEYDIDSIEPIQGAFYSSAHSVVEDSLDNDIASATSASTKIDRKRISNLIRKLDFYLLQLRFSSSFICNILHSALIPFTTS